MGAGGEHATGEQSRLALYLLGALDEAERVSFEEHLAGCWQCLSEATEIGASTSGLAGLADVDWELPPHADPLLTAAPVTTADPAETAPVAAAEPPATAAPPVTEVPAGGAVPPDPARSSADRPGRGPAGSVRPTDARPGGDRAAGARPDRGPTADRGGSRRRRLRIWGGAAAVLLGLALAGGAITANVLGGTDEPVLTASGEAPGYGASLSVSITADDRGRSTIRITVTGLRPGIHYRLYAVTRDGATHTVRDWMASNGPQEVTGETSLPVDELAFVTVGTSDGTGIVTAPIIRGAGSPR
ncbi:zf-HC2 domain-containing protein [Micromonospora ureilytica]|uniref:anti-sigma factor family protein n=1 Tax=Micromonospora ureilytica TaxID=709868 RepID=UPI002E1519B7|nr:zf-HC2 domain-containing protein [Micromonospora ureilytica]